MNAGACLVWNSALFGFEGAGRYLARRDGPLVKRLRRRPLTPQTWVRFPHGSPFSALFLGLDNGVQIEYNDLSLKRTVRRRKFQSFFCLLFFSKKSKLVLIAVRVHPFPFRTRKLSSLAPKILVWRRTGKIGNANTKRADFLPAFLLLNIEHSFYFG